MGVVGFEIDARVPNTDTTIVMLRSIVNQTLGDRPRVVPDHSPSPAVEGVGIVRGGDKHQTVYNDGSDFEAVRMGRMKYPLSAQLSDVGEVDLVEIAVASSGVVAIVGQPVLVRWLSGQLLRLNVHGDGYGSPALLRGPTRLETAHGVGHGGATQMLVDANGEPVRIHGVGFARCERNDRAVDFSFHVTKRFSGLRGSQYR